MLRIQTYRNTCWITNGPLRLWMNPTPKDKTYANAISVNAAVMIALRSTGGEGFSLGPVNATGRIRYLV